MEMRRIRYGADVPVAERDRHAAAFRAKGRIEEAVLLYDGRADHPDLTQDVAWAIEHGAAFVLLSLEKMGRNVTDEERRACAVSAERLGRWYDAHRLYTRLADEAALARVSEKLPGFQIAVPENKK